MAKISLKKAVKGKTPFDLSQVHITTTDFGMPQVTSILEVVPDDDITINVNAEARLAPMVVPTFMDVSLVTRSFFVPMSAIYKNFEYFYTDRQDSSTYKTFPTISNSTIANYFMSNGLSTVLNYADVGDYYDFKYTSGGVTTYFIFTDKGRWFYKLLLSLGYGINFTSGDTTSFSILPLVAYLRIVYDYLYPSQYVDGLGLTSIFTAASSSDYFAYDTIVLSKVVALYNMPFRQDYFTAAWKDINKPGSSSQNITTNSSMFANRNEQAISADNYVAQVAGTGSSKSALSAYGLQLVQRLYDFVTRNNIVGVRYADQILARFGVGSRRSDPDMSRFIKRHEQPVRVYDVTATTAAQNQELGDLAGKGYSSPENGGNLVQFNSDGEFGYIICISHVEPKIGYYQGRKRHTLHTSRFSFYTPEFDMQMRAIRNDELFADYRSDTEYTAGQSYGGAPDGVFGFAPNYTEYKKQEQFLTGDFRVPSLKRNLDAYHLFRDIPVPSSLNALSLSNTFLMMHQNEFDKIFAQISTVRVPISWQEFDGKEYLAVNNQIVTLYVETKVLPDGTTDSSYHRFLVNIIREGDAITAILSTNFSRYLIICHDPTTETTSSMTSYHLEFTLFGETFVCTMGVPKTGTYSDLVFGGMHHGTALIETADELFSFYQSYIDHFYIKYVFDIKATRPMVPVSEEFMISDGGERQSVSMNGNYMN